MAAVKRYEQETPMHVATREYIYVIMADGCESGDKLKTILNEKPSDGAQDNYQSIYKEIWKWNVIDHRRAYVC